MSTKPKAEAAENAAEETKAEDELVEIELFKDNKDYKDDLFVCINGKNMVVKRGEKVKIPKAYADVINQSRKQGKATANLMDSKQNEYTNELRARNM